MPYDAILVVSFGGPEGHDDVIPFLENVLRGRNVPRERLLEVAEHYYRFEGRSPINEQTRALIAALEGELATSGPHLPVYWGNRNWHPMLTDAVRRMRDDGVRQVVAFATSAFPSYSGCRQYLDNIAAARAEVGPDAPSIDMLPPFGAHPEFAAVIADRIVETGAGPEAELIFTAHSIPLSMANICSYTAELNKACAAVAGSRPGRLVYQSRSGPPNQPWLEPDIGDALRNRAAAGNRSPVVVIPIGFLSDHIEVLWDLDTAARAVAEECGIPYFRAATAGTHPRFVRLLRDRIAAAATSGVSVCAAGCCPAPVSVPRPRA